MNIDKLIVNCVVDNHTVETNAKVPTRNGSD